MYGTVEKADEYHEARGRESRWDAVTDKEAALLRGSEYIDQRYRQKLKSGRWLPMFRGQRTEGREQAREWPRTGAADYAGHEIPDDQVPVEVEHAAYEAALREGENPGSLSPDYVMTEQVRSEKAGPIETNYVPTSNLKLPQGVETPNRPIIPEIDEIMAPLLVPRYDMPGVRTV